MEKLAERRYRDVDGNIAEVDIIEGVNDYGDLIAYYRLSYDNRSCYLESDYGHDRQTIENGEGDDEILTLLFAGVGIYSAMDKNICPNYLKTVLENTPSDPSTPYINSHEKVL